MAGYHPKGYKVFYENNRLLESGVCGVSDTWWGRVIDFFQGVLLVNNSWAGSRVGRLEGSEALFPSGCSEERTSGLHGCRRMGFPRNIAPDIIMIYLGTNDWTFGTPLFPEDGHGEDCCYFSTAYGKMLGDIRKKYPKAEVWCCSLSTTFMSGNIIFKFPYNYKGVHINMYNEIIRQKTLQYQEIPGGSIKYIDMYKYKKPYETIDGSHPNQSGMIVIAELILREMELLSGENQK